MRRGAVNPIAMLARHLNIPTFLDHAFNITDKFVELRWLCFNAVKSIMRQVMHDATGVRLLAARQVDGCYFSGVIYSIMAVVVGGSRILFFDFGIQDLSRSLKSKIKAAHSYAFPDSSRNLLMKLGFGVHLAYTLSSAWNQDEEV
ncbi:uncharacterized protein LOC110917044 isoform X2 [Helianthus annuus]|uniref:uncharacterized protein LOC110917044 isoform X2 n=1 Tax=Helianthus annuus TaxID=4232 RepID=UPI000B905ACC|nr:uncharacterized protein LOC110917044 isoform X2 [Helianthus annuus]